MQKEDFQKLEKNALDEEVDRLVVGAIILRDNNVLILKRKKEDFLEGLEELPSGKVENYEALNDALYREVAEETNLEVENIVSYVGSFDYKSKSGKLTRQLNFFVKVKDTENVKLLEHDSFTWVSKQELAKHNISEEVKRLITDVF